MSKTPSVESLNQEIQTLREEQLTLALAVTGQDDWPECSYAPFIPWQQDYVMFLSGLASHTKAIENHPKVGVMVIQNKTERAAVFARRRLVLRCERIDVVWNEEDKQQAFALFEARHGKMIRTLQSLPDFRLVTLRPVSGRYVRGFGQAYDLHLGRTLTDNTCVKG